MVSPVSVVFILLFPAVVYGHPAGYQFPLHPQKLDCNTVTGILQEHDVNFSRPLENGDEIIWRGTIWPNMAVVRFDIYRETAPAVAIHLRQDVGSLNSAFTEMPSGSWIQELPGPLMLSRGEKFEIGMRLVGNNFEIRKNGQHVYTYTVRYPTSIAGVHRIDQYGHFTITSIEMKCVNPPRRPHDHSREHRPHGHSHEHRDSSDFSSEESSDGSSDESC